MTTGLAVHNAIGYNPKSKAGMKGFPARTKAKSHLMDFGGIYHFLFETFYGIGCLVGLGLIISFIACIVLERKTRSIYKNHEKTEDDWSLCDDGDDE